MEVNGRWFLEIVDRDSGNLDSILILRWSLVVIMLPPPHPQTLPRSHDNLQNPYRIASIFHM